MNLILKEHHDLYQADFLVKSYGFDLDELVFEERW